MRDVRRFMLAWLMAAALGTPTPTAEPPSPQHVLALIRERFRSHRPPPPFESYTLIRSQKPASSDSAGNYTKHVWVRNIDRAALFRFVYRGNVRGQPTFDRPAFNERRDPGPPTADVFEPAPARPRAISDVPTPEPRYVPLPVIGAVRTVIDPDYRVDELDVVGDEVHLSIVPVRDVDRNRLREVVADRRTYELHRLVATDKLFVADGRVFPITFTIAMGSVLGRPVVTGIHAVVGGGYRGDGEVIDYVFADVAFPRSLPDWYFDPRTYPQHQRDAPS